MKSSCVSQIIRPVSVNVKLKLRCLILYWACNNGIGLLIELDQVSFEM